VRIQSLILRAGMLFRLLIVQAQLAISHRFDLVVEQVALEPIIYQLLLDAFNILKYLMHLVAAVT